jgi:hypothetical protein
VVAGVSAAWAWLVMAVAGGGIVGVEMNVYLVMEIGQDDFRIIAAYADLAGAKACKARREEAAKRYRAEWEVWRLKSDAAYREFDQRPAQHGAYSWRQEWLAANPYPVGHLGGWDICVVTIPIGQESVNWFKWDLSSGV